MPDTNEAIDREAYLELRLRYAERLNQILFSIVHHLDGGFEGSWSNALTLGEKAKLRIFMSDEYLARSYDG